MTREEKYMKVAIKMAEKARDKDEVPIGAVIVKDDKIIAKAYNRRNESRISTHHAEVLAIEKACKKLKDWRLSGCEIFVTLEPCVMCAGAIVNARIDKVYFGAYEKKSGAVLSNFKITMNNGLNHTSLIEGGVLEKECSNLLKEYFEDKRKA